MSSFNAISRGRTGVLLAAIVVAAMFGCESAPVPGVNGRVSLSSVVSPETHPPEDFRSEDALRSLEMHANAAAHAAGFQVANATECADSLRVELIDIAVKPYTDARSFFADARKGIEDLGVTVTGRTPITVESNGVHTTVRVTWARVGSGLAVTETASAFDALRDVTTFGVFTINDKPVEIRDERQANAVRLDDSIRRSVDAAMSKVSRNLRQRTEKLP